MRLFVPLQLSLHASAAADDDDAFTPAHAVADRLL